MLVVAVVRLLRFCCVFSSACIGGVGNRGRTAKYEEAECNMPMISELADATEMSLTTPIVTRGELELVQK